MAVGSLFAWDGRSTRHGGGFSLCVGFEVHQTWQWVLSLHGMGGTPDMLVGSLFAWYWRSIKHGGGFSLCVGWEVHQTWRSVLSLRGIGGPPDVVVGQFSQPPTPVRAL